jgi:hypothetical protein
LYTKLIVPLAQPAASPRKGHGINCFVEAESGSTCVTVADENTSTIQPYNFDTSQEFFTKLKERLLLRN